MARLKESCSLFLIISMMWCGVGPVALADEAVETPQAATDAEPEATEAEPWKKGLPLPVHTIEGVGGGAIVPVAIILNPGPGTDFYSLPTISMTYVGLEDKSLQSFAVTETLFQKVELGFSALRMGLGNFPMAVENATTIDIGTSDLWLYSLNARGQVIEDGQFVPFMPSVVIGTQFKFNSEVDKINNRLGGALTGIGYDRDWGVDFTVTATKMIPVFSRPLFLTAGMRVSSAAWAGLLGFSDDYHVTGEASAIYVPFDWLFVAFEYRQMPDVYGTIPGLIRTPGDWYTLVVGLILSDRLTLTGLYGNFGNTLNTKSDGGWAIQLKYEF